MNAPPKGAETNQELGQQFCTTCPVHVITWILPTVSVCVCRKRVKHVWRLGDSHVMSQNKFIWGFHSYKRHTWSAGKVSTIRLDRKKNNKINRIGFHLSISLSVHLPDKPIRPAREKQITRRGGRCPTTNHWNDVNRNACRVRRGGDFILGRL